jgi:hypothetical protein
VEAPQIYPIAARWRRALTVVAVAVAGAVPTFIPVLIALATRQTYRCYFPPSDAAFDLSNQWQDATRERWIPPSEVCLALSQVVAARNHDGWPIRNLKPQTGYAVSCKPSEEPVRSRPPANSLAEASRETAGPLQQEPDRPTIALLNREVRRTCLPFAENVCFTRYEWWGRPAEMSY